MIKAVIFDCFGVLTADKWREFVDNLPPEANISRARELNHQYDAGLIDLGQFMDQVEEATGHRPEQIERLLDNETVKNDALIDYIRELKPNYKIGLLSNIATDWITAKFLTQEEAQLFDGMVFSYMAGTTKPDPEIYKLICNKLDVDPQNVVFIDDVEDYCEAAKQLGISAVHYTGFNQMKSELEPILNQE